MNFRKSALIAVIISVFSLCGINYASAIIKRSAFPPVNNQPGNPFYTPRINYDREFERRDQIRWENERREHERERERRERERYEYEQRERDRRELRELERERYEYERRHRDRDRYERDRLEYERREKRRRDEEELNEFFRRLFER